MNDLQIVVFSLNRELCGVDTSHVQEIILCKDIVKVAKMPKFIEGVINYRGIMVPIINLNKRFGFGETEITKKTKIIITRINEILLGFMVNEVPEIIKVAGNEIEPAPEILKQAGNVYMKNIAKVNSKIISVLDLGLILKDDELKKIEKIENETIA
ncbi:MAG: chemotaxis protein CheW [Bacillota bacterium]|nr:chemotaxis protein CheW [Bacillota bacterium]